MLVLQDDLGFINLILSGHQVACLFINAILSLYPAPPKIMPLTAYCVQYIESWTSCSVITRRFSSWCSRCFRPSTSPYGSISTHPVKLTFIFDASTEACPWPIMKLRRPWVTCHLLPTPATSSRIYRLRSGFGGRTTLTGRAASSRRAS